MNNKIIAVVGMCGSGKSVAVNLIEKQGFKKIYFGEATFKKMKELNLELNSENERKVREMLRESGDKGIYAKIYLNDIKKAHKEGNVVIESMYSWSEYKILKEEFKDDFLVLSIVTDASIRYERLENRAFRPLTKEEALSRDYLEIENIEKGGPIGIADHFILNNGSQAQLKREILKFLKQI